MIFDLSKKINATGQRRDNRGNIIGEGIVETQMGTIVVACYSRVRSITEAKALQSMLAKAKKPKEETFTDEEFKQVYTALLNRPIDEMVSFSEMVETLNIDFSFEDYEKNLQR
jgi:hypothetical protein